MALIGNKVLEKDLRDYLTSQGFFGRSAQFSNVRLAALQRLGWLQVFTFDVRAKHESAGWRGLLGACLDDERSKLFEVVVGEDPVPREGAISKWSQGLITKRTGDPLHPVAVALLGLFVVVFVFVICSAIAQS